MDGSSVAKLPAADSRGESRAALAAWYRKVRDRTETLAAPLSAEDQTIQSMPDASPTKWHRAHTTWFFETFLLRPHLPGYTVFDASFGYVFNSYYESVGPRHARPSRGLLSRPGVAAIAAYRAHVDEAMQSLLAICEEDVFDKIVLGLHHEQQHQELLLTDIKHALSLSPLDPVYATGPNPAELGALASASWINVEGGVYEIGYRPTGAAFEFWFDNEGPRHSALLQDFAIADRPVSNGEYRAFMDDGGYDRPEFWLSEGWALAKAEAWTAPAYWRREKNEWRAFTLRGMDKVRDDEPVCHVSFFEAAAYAAWAGCRLPTEFEWELAVGRLGGPDAGTEDIVLHPGPLKPGRWQEVWEWTASPYSPYPGFRPAAGALGEYNGKFMINQMVLRGRSCATAPGHERLTYRNFFPTSARWQFSGFRLAKDQ
jgi:ergothioneine biosynthesis protein EgtB